MLGEAVQPEAAAIINMIDVQVHSYIQRDAARIQNSELRYYFAALPPFHAEVLK